MTGIRALRMTWAPLRQLRWIAVAIFAVAGSLKLIGVPAMVTMFATIGMGQWFRYAVGLAELGGAVFLAIPRLVLPGSLALTGLMLGAVSIDVIVLRRAPLFSSPTLLLVLCIAWDAAHSPYPSARS